MECILSKRIPQGCTVVVNGVTKVTLGDVKFKANTYKRGAIPALSCKSKVSL
jgi:hypothetical protein